MLNYASFGDLVPNQTTPSCVTSDDVLNTEFITALCMNNELAKSKLYKHFEKCETITHDIWETIEDFNDCIEPYISKVLPQVFDNIIYSNRQTQLLSYINSHMAGKLSVGIHIRWGDTSTGDLTRLDSRSIGIKHVNEFYMSTLMRHRNKFNFYVFMEHYHTGLSALLDIEDYSIIDTGNDLFDLNLFSKMDIVMHGPSTFAVLASLISPGKLIITSTPTHTRFVYTKNAINEIVSYKDNSYNITRFIDSIEYKRMRQI